MVPEKGARAQVHLLRIRSAAAAVSLDIVRLVRARCWFWPPRGCGRFVNLSLLGRVWCWFWPPRGRGGFVGHRGFGSRAWFVLAAPRLRWFR